MLGLLLAAHLIATVTTGHMVADRLAALRGAGDPLSLRDLAPRAPDGAPNAAEVYQQAFDSLRLSREDEAALSASQPWAVRDAGLPASRLRANQAALALFAKASRMPDCAFPVNWDDPINAQFPHLAKLELAANLLAAQSSLEATAGDLDAALETCETILHMADHVQREPTVVSLGAANAIRQAAVAALANVLQAGTPPPGPARRLLARLTQSDFREPLVRAAKGERAFGLVYCDRLRRGAPFFRHSPTPTQSAIARLYGTVGRPWLNYEEVVYLDMAAEMIEASALRWPASVEAARNLEARVVRPQVGSKGAVRLTEWLLDSRVMESTEKSVALLSAAEIGLKVKLCAQQRGGYPASLSELRVAGWQLPRDPFSQADYRYRREDQGFVVWSVGPDGQDNSAAPQGRVFQFSKAPQPPYDLPFRCLR